jgi:hypothetical protein
VAPAGSYISRRQPAFQKEHGSGPSCQTSPQWRCEKGSRRRAKGWQTVPSIGRSQEQLLDPVGTQRSLPLGRMTPIRKIEARTFSWVGIKIHFGDQDYEIVATSLLRAERCCFIIDLFLLTQVYLQVLSSGHRHLRSRLRFRKDNLIHWGKGQLPGPAGVPEMPKRWM